MVSSFWRKQLPVLLALFSVVLVLVSVADNGVAQRANGMIKGVVTEAETGNPLVGTNIVLVGTRLGATTDTEGNFEILRVPPGTYTIESSFIGYKKESKEVTVRRDGEVTVNFDLVVDVLGLDEIVVTGMGGVQIKEKLGVSISSVKADEIVQAAEVNVVQALAGKAANVEINQTSGDPGSSSYIRIRGGGSIDRGTQPLFVVDGVPIDNSRIDGDRATSSGSEASNRAGDINNEDIESIEILKGSAAAAIYGSRASNGVVLITTKSGKPGKTRVDYKFAYGTTKVNHFIDLQQMYGQGTNEVSKSTTTNYSWGPLLDASTPTFDHARDVTDGGYSMEHNVTVSGGNEMTTFFMSAGRYEEEGHWVAGSHYQRTNFRLKGSQVVTEKLKITGNVMYARVTQDMIQRGDNAAGIGIGSLRTPPDFDNRIWLDPDTGWHRSYTTQNPATEYVKPSFDNPFWVMYEHINNQVVNRVQGYARLDYDLTDFVQLSYTLGSDHNATETLNVMPPGSKRGDGRGRLRRGDWTIHELDANFVATVQGDKFLNRWDWVDGTLMLGHTLNSRHLRRIWASGQDFGVSRGFNQLENTNPSFLEPNEYEWKRNIESFFSQMTIDLWDQLYLTGALRNDGSSTFGESEKRHWYPKASMAWEFTKSSMMPAIPYLDFGKFRFAYGVAGVQPGVYAILSSYTAGTEGFGVYTDASLTPKFQGQAGFRSQTNLGNKDIKPERTREYETGLDLAFWDSRIGMELTYYDQYTTDVIFDLNVAPSRGFYSQESNAATISNKGVELAIDITPVRKRNFTWDARFIWATNKNEVEDMSGADWEGIGGNAYAAPGHPLGEYRMATWVRFGHGMTYDIDGDGVRENIDEVYAGQWTKNDVYVDADGMPKKYDAAVWSGMSWNADWTGSIRNTFTFFQDWTLGVFVDIVNDRYMNNYGKGQLYSYGTHGDTELRYTEAPINIWLKHGEKAVGPGATNGVGVPVYMDKNFFRNVVGYGGDRWSLVEDAGYIKLREISLSYNLRHDYLRQYGISAINFMFSGRNLKTWTTYSGWDPDTNRSQTGNSRGIDYFNSPQIRGLNFSMRVSF